jgi:deoxyribonuclease-4
MNHPLIGAHMSIAGGLHLAFEHGASVGCSTIQIFTKKNNQWNSKPLTDEEVLLFKSAQKKFKIKPVAAHTAYLINLCASNKYIIEKSRLAFAEELRRCEMLGIPYLIFHPGAHTGAGESEGIKKIIESLNLAHHQTKNYKGKSVLETTAGQGSSLGYRFEQLRKIIDGVDNYERMEACIDTSHIFAAGYNIRNKIVYRKTMKEFNNIVGINKLAIIHCNDSKKELGSRVDRHEHIGKGTIGKEAFRLIMQDKRFSKIPKIIETPKGADLAEDKMNLAVLKKLAKQI